MLFLNRAMRSIFSFYFHFHFCFQSISLLYNHLHDETYKWKTKVRSKENTEKKSLSGAKEILDDLTITVRVILPNETKALFCLQSVLHLYVVVTCVTKDEKKKAHRIESND